MRTSAVWSGVHRGCWSGRLGYYGHRSCIVDDGREKFHLVHPQCLRRIEGFNPAQTSNLVYIITCRACTLSYVGETGRRLGDRFCEHLRSVSKKADLPVAKHFSSPGHTTDDMMVAVVRAGLHNTRDRRRAEGRLIFKCKTLQPRGINIDFNFIWANSSSARFKCCHIWIKWRAFSVTASSTDEGTVVPKRLDFQTF